MIRQMIMGIENPDSSVGTLKPHDDGITHAAKPQAISGIATGP